MASTGDPLLQKAKATSFRLLKLRPRSTKEIRERLLQKGYPPDIVTRVVQDLLDMEFLDDEAFAKAWIRWRLSGRPVGLRKLAAELRQKGISEDIVAGYLAEAREDYDELAVIREVAAKQARAYTGLPVLKRRKRLFDYLMRRGFPAEAINKVIREI